MHQRGLLVGRECAHVFHRPRAVSNVAHCMAANSFSTSLKTHLCSVAQPRCKLTRTQVQRCSLGVLACQGHSELTADAPVVGWLDLRLLLLCATSYTWCACRRTSAPCSARSTPRASAMSSAPSRAAHSHRASMWSVMHKPGCARLALARNTPATAVDFCAIPLMHASASQHIQAATS